MKKSALAPLIACVVCIGRLAFADAVGIHSASFSHVTAFDALGTGSVDWKDDSTVPGVYIANSAAGKTYPLPLPPSTGSSGRNGFYNLGLSGGSHRLLGMLPGNTMGHAYAGVRYRNLTGQDVLKIKYHVVLEQWGTRNTAEQTVTLSYKVSGLGDLNDLAAPGWTALGTGTTPAVGAGSPPYSDGTGSSFAISGAADIHIANGRYLTFRIMKRNESGGDALIGIKSMTIESVAAGRTVATPAHSKVSGLEATVRSGQVFLTWNEQAATDETTFCVFLHDRPIHAKTLEDAQKVGFCIEAGSACDWWENPASFDADAVPDRSHGFLIDGKELDPKGGLFVHTVTASDPQNLYFAVLPESGTADDLVAGKNTLSAPVHAEPALPQPFRLKDAPAAGSGAGKSLMLLLHGRGGGGNSGGKANFLVFGDAKQGWREGLARKFIVKSDDKSITIQSMDRMWIGRPLTYSWDARDHVPAINTWWIGCNDHIYDPETVQDGVVVNYTEEHLLYLVRWAQQYFGTDTERTYISGNSMGGTGAISVGFHRPDVFASIFSSVPIAAYTRRAGADGISNLRRLDGLCGRPCDETVMSSDGIPLMDRMNSEKIAMEYAGDLPFLVLYNGRTDKSMPWINNPSFYRALNSGRRGFACFWNNEPHRMSKSGTVPSDITDFYNLHPDMTLNISYPAFSNCSDNRNPGNGARDDGDIIGWMNRGIYWTEPVETVDSWSIGLQVQGDFLPPSITVDVTPRRLTQFCIQPQETLLVNGQPLQADENGLLTIRGVQLSVDRPVQITVQRKQETR